MVSTKNKKVKKTPTRRAKRRTQSMKKAVRGKAVVSRATAKDNHKIFAKRPRVKRSWLSRSKALSFTSHAVSRRVILVVIGLTAMAVVLATLLTIFNTPERVVKGKIEEIARDYYETYYYAEILRAAETSEREAAEILMTSATRGIPKMDLEQLLLFGGGRHQSAAGTLKRYCDQNGTFVVAYPEEPYGQKDYRLEINYACNF